MNNETNNNAAFEKKDGRMPRFYERRHYGSWGSFFIYAIIYAVALAIVCIMLYFGISKLVGIYSEADPDRVVDAHLEYLSGGRLYNDIVLGVRNGKTVYESEKDASATVMEMLDINGEKNFCRVSAGDSYISYDVYSGDNRVYNVILGKKAESTGPIGITFWEVKEILFYSECIDECKSGYYISAPADAEIFLNGIALNDEMIIDENYLFFIGSVWESELPEDARCVLYYVDGIFGEPEFSASLDGEELDTYVDEDGVFHAKYPKEWVKDYTFKVPSGASLYVNGVLATQVSSKANAPATAFEELGEGMMDVYVIEGLFDDPSVSASINGVSLGDAVREGDCYTFSFNDDMYYKAQITVPRDVTVKVNGVILNFDNSISEPITFAEWSAFNIKLNSYMPNELRAKGFKMPDFITITVSELYNAPTVEASYNGVAYDPIKTGEGDGVSTFVYDFPIISGVSSVESFAERFSKQYIKYITEGCYGQRDDVEMRKNFYTNWINYLSYIMNDSLCYDSALDSYSDVEYRPNASVTSESYSVQNLVKYSDDLYCCVVICTVKDTINTEGELSVIDLMIVKQGSEFKVWSHSTIEY